MIHFMFCKIIRTFSKYETCNVHFVIYTRTRTYDHIRSSIVHERTNTLLCLRCISNEIHGGRLSFTHSPLKLDELRPRLRRVVYTRSLPRARDGDRNHYALWVRDPRLCAHSNTGAEEFTSRSACTRISFRLERPSVFI